MESVIRKARLSDVEAIYALITEASKTTPVLPRSRAEIYETIRDFFVCEADGNVVGCCALHVAWIDLAEVKSLAVCPEQRGHGFGRHLVEACLEEARQMQLPQVFALTPIPDFFARVGFAQIDKSELPHKVWGECVRCPKFPDCDEVAVRTNIAATGPATAQ